MASAQQGRVHRGTAHGACVGAPLTTAAASTAAARDADRAEVRRRAGREGRASDATYQAPGLGLD